MSQEEPDTDATARTTQRKSEEPGEKEDEEEGREAVKSINVMKVNQEERERKNN